MRFPGLLGAYYPPGWTGLFMFDPLESRTQAFTPGYDYLKAKVIATHLTLAGCRAPYWPQWWIGPNAIA